MVSGRARVSQAKVYFGFSSFDEKIFERSSARSSGEEKQMAGVGIRVQVFGGLLLCTKWSLVISEKCNEQCGKCNTKCGQCNVYCVWAAQNSVATGQ